MKTSLKSLTYIKCAIAEIEEFFAAADHLQLDESIIESQFKKLLIEQHCIDHEDESMPLDAMGILKNDLFQFEILGRQMGIDI